jgi:hypothetical protein
MQVSGGSPAAADFARIAMGVRPLLVAGQQVWAQYVSRDPEFRSPDNVNLTDAGTFIIQP